MSWTSHKIPCLLLHDRLISPVSSHSMGGCVIAKARLGHQDPGTSLSLFIRGSIFAHFIEYKHLLESQPAGKIFST